MIPAAVRRWLPWAALALVAVLPLLELALPSGWRIASQLVPIFIYAMLGLGLNIVVGWTGILHLGAAAFMAAGAYAYAISTCPVYPFQFGFWGGCAIAIVAAAAVGLVLGLPTIRLRGDYLAIVTLGFGEITLDVLRNLSAITKGTQGLNPLPPPSLAGVDFTTWEPRYYLYLIILLIAVLIMRNIDRSRLGRALVAVREDELAARAMGVRVVRTKLIAFAGGAAVCGLAGAMAAANIGTSADPSGYDFMLSCLAICIVILGGLGSLPGVLIGALIMGGFNTIVLTRIDALIVDWTGHSTTRNVLLSPTNWKFLVFGLTLVLMMRLRPEGLIPARRVAAELRDGRADADADPVARRLG